ncbi:MAG: spherulation-specific family 4 protein [Ktedonobacteraceae bacterium]
MRKHSCSFGRGLAWLMVCSISLLIQPNITSASERVSNQHQGVPAYFYPHTGNPSNAWNRMCATMNAQQGPSTAVMNPDSGPGTAKNADYVNAIQSCHSHGQQVIGYVHTSYGQRPLATVESEVSEYYQWYQVDGIFVDEMSNDSSTAAYYHALYQSIHAQGGSQAALVVGNPGAAASSAWQLTQQAADELLIFEGSAKASTSWSPPAWVATYAAGTFWNVVYHAPTLASLQTVCRHAQTANAGFVYVTYGTLPNPYGFLPKVSYWNSELAAC